MTQWVSSSSIASLLPLLSVTWCCSGLRFCWLQQHVTSHSYYLDLISSLDYTDRSRVKHYHHLSASLIRSGQITSTLTDFGSQYLGNRATDGDATINCIQVTFNVLVRYGWCRTSLFSQFSWWMRETRRPTDIQSLGLCRMLQVLLTSVLWYGSLGGRKFQPVETNYPSKILSLGVSLTSNNLANRSVIKCDGSSEEVPCEFITDHVVVEF